MTFYNGQKISSGNPRRDHANVLTIKASKTTGFFSLVDSEGIETRKLGPVALKSLITDGLYRII